MITLYFEINNPEIALTLLYVDLKATISQFKGDECAIIHKSIKRSYVSKHYFEKKKLFFCY